MRYRFEDQDGMHTLTRDEVLAQFFPYWSAQMQKAGKADLIAEELCLADWLIVHWGWTVEDKP